MRRDRGRLESRGTWIVERFAAILLILGFAVVLGLGHQAVPAAPPAGDEPGYPPFNLDYFSNDAQLVIALRPAVLAKLKSLESLKPVVKELGITEPLGIPIEEIEEFRLVLNLPSPELPPGPENQPWPVMMLRSKRPFDWKKLAAELLGEGDIAETQANGQTFFYAKQPRGLLSAYWHPDDRTIVLTVDKEIERTFTLRGLADERGWRGKSREVADAPAALMMKAALAQPVTTMLQRDVGEVDVLADDAEMLLMKGTEVDGVFQVAGIVECTSPEGARRIEATVRRVMQVFKVEIARTAELVRAQQKAGVAVGRAGFPDIVLKLIETTKLDVRGNTLQSLTKLDKSIGESISAAIPPARVAARRNVSANNLKRIMLAMHNYHDKHQTFPPASIVGADGKTAHSWRVALLPFFEDQEMSALYKRYKFDEPWDSENNKAVIKAGSKLFSVPSEKGEPGDGTCSYFLVVGPGTAFDPSAEPTKVRNITDGTSRTIGIVEAKRPIPWTKPEDIEYDPDKPIPKLGGYFEGGFNTAWMDGSVHYLPSAIDEATMRALFSMAGGEVIVTNPQTDVPQVQ